MKKLSVLLLLGLSSARLLTGCGDKESAPEETPSVMEEAIP